MTGSWLIKRCKLQNWFIMWINSHPLRLSRRHWRRTYQRKHQSQHQRSQPCNQRQFFKFLRISHHFKSTPIFQILWKENLITSSAGHESHRRSLSHRHLPAEKKIYNCDLIFEHPEKEIYNCDVSFENPQNPNFSNFDLSFKKSTLIAFSTSINLFLRATLPRTLL